MSALSERSTRAVWHPCSQMKQHETLPPLPVARAQGLWLYDPDGKRYLDGISSWWVNLFGHGHPHITGALHRQLDTLAHVMLAGCTHEPVVALSEKLGALTGLGHAFYASDGASATEIALKMSAHYWRNHGRFRKTRFIGLRNGYHGETAGALSVTDIPLFRDAYGPLLRISATVPTPDARKAAPGVSAEEHTRHCVQALKAYLEVHHAETAALIVEPLVQCAAGIATYDPEYLREARALCDHYEVHLVADEIAVGFGRTGTLFACEQAGPKGIRPDFMCLSKGLTSGTLPLSLVLTTDEVYAAFYDDRVARGFLHSHSYTGNPLACRAALAVLEVFEQRDWMAANRETAARLTALCAPLMQHDKVLRTRQIGMMWGFDIATDDPAFARRYHMAALQRGLLLRPIANTLYFMPPYVIDEEESAWLAEGALAALNDALAT
ncbi:adenosylmethionine--8-amino-7-oxononanoate transaminase [Rhizobacter sp. J219]|jgi:adenosylmethionine-8-amino-7-oxononanoate aminotransferase|uniref:adenosylmethionine--8-amino-7-oxononanoate transaminase n=1 Tax=Rhizobacter sp. J219 TaxID=2898430 RepID=UPI0021507DDB|nr:adenosylmethionine--8-amino-7-oxononanoate transaminase [Rhizobacter sp. J219]MCR5884544.1 adenosylmethionine--8-amino-7-oxononanoate transaminase [Rhizobacter sp. J219]